jgi:hypothetical protein
MIPSERKTRGVTIDQKYVSHAGPASGTLPTLAPDYGDE